MKYIKLHIKAPIMSFGTGDSLFQSRRDTATRPLKSAIVGLIAGAMGYDRGDEKIADMFKNLNILTSSEPYNLHVLRDYHITAPMEFYQKNHSFHKTVLKSKKEFDKNFTDSLPSDKYYITNGDFLVFVGTEDENLLKDIYDTLQSPIYGIYIGRKCSTSSIKLTENEFIFYSEDDLIREIEKDDEEKKIIDKQWEMRELCSCM